MENILVIGASGQIGSELTMALRERYGNNNVFATDIKDAPADVMESGPFHQLNVMDVDALNEFISKHNINQIYLLAAVLSGNAEKRPIHSWDLNMSSLMSVLELCKTKGINKLFWPSSIAVFGPTTPKDNTPQITITEPNTVYGISKLAGERWVEYYNAKFGVDVRGVRYPGLISYKTEPGGGTTDYAVEIFYKAIEDGKYECFLSKDTELPMMFMPDAIKATLDLMEADADKLSIRNSYNLAGFSFSPEQISEEIKKHLPDFEVTYNPDFRQKIADSWPRSIDDSTARADWGWKHEYGLSQMVEIMLQEVKSKLGK
jgi:nucleoside-diphosphate-sugar epimerase